MSKKQFILRMGTLYMLMLAIAGVLALRLVYLQMVKGAEYEAVAARQSSVRYDIKASRGVILDRNGVSLVSNELSYSVRFNYYGWDKERQNEVIVKACRVLGESGLGHNDTLPISEGYPIVYTYESLDSGAGKDLARFVEKNLKRSGMPSAGELYTTLCERYKIDESLDFLTKRLLVGVRYEMEIREFSAYTPFTLASGVDMETVGHLAQLERELPGVSAEADNSRKYDTDIAAHILGRVGLIWKEEYAELKDQGYGLNAVLGKDGAEKAFESRLRGIDGKETVVSDMTGKVIERYISEEPRPGDNCYLTIDIELQRVAEQSLADTIENIRRTGARQANRQGADAEGGAAVVVDVRTGEVLAMANYPTYSLLTFKEDWDTIKEDPLSPMLNRCIAGLYPPGSTFKMVTSAAGLQEGLITPNTKITDLGIYTYWEDYQPRCWIFRDTGRTHGRINVSSAIKYSCNYFFFEVGRQMGIETLVSYTNRFGLGKLTGIELAGERAGQVASPETIKDWQGGLVLQAAIGQSAHQFTPLQLANYVAMVVNGGTRYRPHLLKKAVDYTFTETTYDPEPEVVETMELEPSTVAAIKEGMRGVVTEDGTASAVFKGYPLAVGGKTGSAQTRKGRSAHGVFVSFAPYDDPQIAVCVVGEHAGSGGNVAPVAVEIYNKYFGLNMPEEDLEDEAQPAAGQ